MGRVARLVKRTPPYLHDGSDKAPTELEEPGQVHVGQLRRLSLLVDDVLSRWVTRETHDRLERRVAQLEERFAEQIAQLEARFERRASQIERWGFTRDAGALILLGSTVVGSFLLAVAAVVVLVLAW